MSSDPVKAFWFLFYLQITSGTETCKERSTQTCKGRKRERKNDSQMQRPNPKRSGEIAPLSSQFVLSISLFLDLPFPFELSLIVAAPRRSRLQHRADCDCNIASRDLAFRQTQSPLSLPSSLNLTRFDDIFFWVLFVFLYWRMNNIIYLFDSWENVRKCEQ